MKRSTINWRYILFIAVMCLAQALIYTDGGVLASVQLVVAPKSFALLYDGLFQYQTLAMTGQVNYVTPILMLPVYALGYLVNIVLGAAAYSAFSVFLPTLIAAVGMFYLISELLENSAYSKELALCGAALTVFMSIMITVRDLTAFVPITLCIMLMAYKSANKGSKTNFRLLFALAIALAFQIGFSNFTNILPDLIFFALVSAVMVAFAAKEAKKGVLKMAVFVLAVALLLNSNLITSTYLIYVNHFNNSQYFNQNSLTYLQEQGAMGLPRIIFGFNPENLYTSSGAQYNPENYHTYIYYPHDLTNIVLSSFLIPAILLVFALYALLAILEPEAKKSRRSSKIFMLAVLVGFIVLGIISNTTQPPFGAIFALGLSASSILLTLRTPLLVTFPFLFVPAVMLAAKGADMLIGRMKQTGHTRSMIYLAMFIFVLAYGYAYSFQHVKGAIRTTIPSYVYQVSNFIDSQNGDFSVATLPNVMTDVQISNWYVGPDIYASLITAHPTYTGGSASYDVGFNPQSLAYYSNLSENISTKLVGYDVSNIFGIFGIKYLVVQGDAENRTTCNCSYYSIPWSFNAIYGNLNSGSFERVANFSNTTIYENNNYVPMAYATNIQNYSTAYSDPNLVAGAIKENYLDIHNYSVLDYCDGCIDFVNVPNYTAPTISYREVNPSHFIVNVSNATTPFYLIFRKTFDREWSASYNGSSLIQEPYHAESNGFGNSWYVNRTGSYTISLYYKPQTLGYISWMASLIGASALIFIYLKGTKVVK